MKRFKKVLWSLLGLVLLLVLAFFIFLNSLKPDYKGKKELTGISAQVETYFDTYGIPHIYADNEEDAMRALGYVHAQDRLWQMELLRRAGAGRLSEIFGDLTLETDKFFLSLGIDDHNDKALANLDRSQPSVILAEAYLDGINQFIEDGPTPVEFYLTGLKKQKFELKDRRQKYLLAPNQFWLRSPQKQPLQYLIHADNWKAPLLFESSYSNGFLRS